MVTIEVTAMRVIVITVTIVIIIIIKGREKKKGRVCASHSLLSGVLLFTG